MKITGYKLREAIKRQQVRRDTAASQFTGSLTYYTGQEKLDPHQVSKNLLAAESNLAMLQEEQMRYNSVVRIQPIPGLNAVTLALAIKLIGGFGRAEKMWRMASANKVPSYFSEESRDPSKLYAQRSVTYEDAGNTASEISRLSGALREQIAIGNAQEIESNLDPVLLD